jgi:hypothetical protein
MAFRTRNTSRGDKLTLLLRDSWMPMLLLIIIMIIGTSMGGARTKAVVQDDDGLRVAKFNRDDDRWNNTRVEHAMLRLARECGLTTAESKIETVGGKDGGDNPRPEPDVEAERENENYHRMRRESPYPKSDPVEGADKIPFD